jgi:hypothetical protein
VTKLIGFSGSLRQRSFNSSLLSSFHCIERPLHDDEMCAENNTLLFDYHIAIAEKADF